MKPLALFIALLLSVCCAGQTKLIDEFYRAKSSPNWEFHTEYTTLCGKNFYPEFQLSDSLIIFFAGTPGYMKKSSLPQKILYVMSATTGKLHWYNDRLPYEFKWKLSKAGIIISEVGGIQCYDINTGKLNWSFSTSDTPYDDWSVYVQDSLIYALAIPPGYSNYTSSLVVLNAKTGVLIKSFPSISNHYPVAIKYVHNNKVVMSNNNFPMCFDATTGKELWTNRLESYDSITHKKIFLKQDYYLHFRGDTLFYAQEQYEAGGNEGAYLNVIDISTGKKLKGLFDSLFDDTEYLIDGNTAYFCYEEEIKVQNPLYSWVGSPHIVKLDISKLQQVWDKPSGLKYSDDDMPGAMTVDGMNIYFSVDSTLLVFDKNDCNKNVQTINTREFIADLNQAGNLLFVNIGSPGEWNKYRVFDKEHLSVKYSNVTDMRFLYYDISSNCLYLIDEQNRLLKVKLPK